MSVRIVNTLENQSEQDFILVFLVNDNTSVDDKEKIFNLSNKLNINVVCISEFYNYIKQFDNDYIITSKCDYNYYIYKDCVKDIHDIVKNTKEEIIYYTLHRGVSIERKKDNTFKLMRNCYNFYLNNYPSPMETVIFNNKSFKKYFNIYKNGFNNDCTKSLLTSKIYYKNKMYYINQLHIDRFKYDTIDFIWCKRPNSSNRYTSKFTKIFSNEELKENFGYIV